MVQSGPDGQHEAQHEAQREVRHEVQHDQSARERKLAVCSSAGNLAPADRAELLVMLTTDPTRSSLNKPRKHCALNR